MSNYLLDSVKIFTPLTKNKVVFVEQVLVEGDRIHFTENYVPVKLVSLLKIIGRRSG